MSDTTPSAALFNTPIESGLRSLFVLNAVLPEPCDLQRLVIYDYLLVHSEDVDGGPPSLHPATPLRSGELLVRRALVEDGLRLMIRKGLVEKAYTPRGVQFTATRLARPLLAYLRSRYANRCREIGTWIAGRFQRLSDEELKDYVDTNMGRWGTEFTRESVLWEEVE